MDGSRLTHCGKASTPKAESLVLTPAAIFIINLVVAAIALAIFAPLLSERARTVVAVATAASPLLLRWFGGDVKRCCTSESNAAAILVVDLALLTIASAALLPAAGAAITALGSHLEEVLASVVWVKRFDLAVLGPVALAGFAAQLVDGSIGMGYGLTSSSVLVAAGLSPATASASVHLAQLGTTAVSGLSHARHANVDAPAMWAIAPAGALGAFGGALLLSSLPVGLAKLISGGLLFTLGAFTLLRFLLAAPRPTPDGAAPPSRSLLLPCCGFLGGFVDATGGGGWGPVSTSTLLADGRLPPCGVVGTTSAAEFFVTVAAVAGFGLASLLNGSGAAHGGARLDMMVTLLAGGVAAAPLAPYLVSNISPRLLGVGVGGFICATNLKTLLGSAGVSGQPAVGCHAALLVAWASAVLKVLAAPKREPAGG